MLRFLAIKKVCCLNPILNADERQELKVELVKITARLELGFKLALVLLKQTIVYGKLRVADLMMWSMSSWVEAWVSKMMFGNLHAVMLGVKLSWHCFLRLDSWVRMSSRLVWLSSFGLDGLECSCSRVL